MIRLGATPIVDDAQPLSAILSQLQTRAQPKGNKSTACGSAHDAYALNASFNVKLRFNVKLCKQRRDIDILPLRYSVFLFYIRMVCSANGFSEYIIIDLLVYIINRSLQHFL